MKTKQIQQGDVLLLRVSKLPAGAKRMAADKRGIVLAEGEHTGHHHRAEDCGGLALMEAPSGMRFMVNETDAPITIRHEEHKPVIVEPGIWQIGQVQEKDWFNDMVRKVVD
jgi:hypothetical protein